MTNKNMTRARYKQHVYTTLFWLAVWIGGLGYLSVLAFIDHYLQ